MIYICCRNNRYINNKEQASARWGFLLGCPAKRLPQIHNGRRFLKASSVGRGRSFRRASGRQARNMPLFDAYFHRIAACATASPRQAVCLQRINQQTFYDMAINYSVAAMKNPNPMSEGEVKYYAKAQANGVVTADQLADEIAYATTLTDGDVLNAIRALVSQIKKHLQNGRIVRLEALGSFQVQLRGSGADTEEMFTPSFISEAHIQFRPGISIRQALNVSTLKFRKVPKKKGAEVDGPEV